MRTIRRTVYADRRNLLEYYLEHEFHGQNTLVVFLDSGISAQEYASLRKELATFGIHMDSVINGGYFITTIDNWIAGKIISEHSKGTIRIEEYNGGNCVNENQ